MALHRVLDQRGGVARPLDRALRHPGHAGHGHQVTDDEDVRVALDGEVGLDDHPSGAVGFGSVGLLGDHLAQRAGLHTGRPHLARAFDAALAAVLVLDRDAHVVDRGHHRVELDLDVHLLQPPLRLEAQLRAHRRQHRGRRVEQDDPALAGRDGAKRPGQGALGQLDDLAGQLDARRPGTDHHEGEPAMPLGRVGGDLGGLERAEDAAAQLQGVVDGLHAGRVGGVLVVAEVGLLCAGGHDEAVVGRHRLHAHQVRRDRLRLQVDRARRRPTTPGRSSAYAGSAWWSGRCRLRTGSRWPLGTAVAGTGEWSSSRCRVMSTWHPWGPLERLGRVQAPESASDDDDAMARHTRPSGLEVPAAHLHRTTVGWWVTLVIDE